MYSSCANPQKCAGGHAHQIFEVHVQPQLDLLLIFAMVSVSNGLDCKCVLNDMHVVGSFACDQQHFSPCFLYVSCWDGSLTCTVAVSSTSSCYAHCCSCFCYNSLDCLWSFIFFLSCCFSTCNSFFVPFYLCAIFMSYHHFISWFSKVAFIISGFSWSCNFSLALCYQQPSSCIHCIHFICCVRCILYASFSCCSWCCSLWCCFLISLPMKNLMSSWVGKPMDTWSTTSPSVL